MLLSTFVLLSDRQFSNAIPSQIPKNVSGKAVKHEMMNKMTRKNIPFDFLFDNLVPLEVVVKPMFGMFAIYVGEKIMLILRQRKDHQDTNGVWIATNQEHHKSLKNDLPYLCSISTYSDDTIETEWQVLPADTDDFENSVIKVCDFIKHNDPRIGRIPKPRKTKNKSTVRTKKTSR